jgi:pimeloyl-ACP methyl ester carboxylesterase
MPTIRTDDGVDLHYEEAGSGTPLVFVHEFAGDHRSWEPQMRFFARRYRCVAFNARGYPPSGVPHEPAAYSQDRATDDVAAVIGALGLAPAHVVGLSMGGVGYGAAPGKRDQFRAEVDATADRIAAEGMWRMARTYGRGPTRLVFEEKDPRGYAEFLSQLGEHDTDGAALTMRGVQRERPSLFELEAGFRAMRLPTLIVCGDEDDPTLEPGLFLKRTIPTSALLVLPRCGHTMNLEDPDAFNRGVLDFLTWVDSGRWWARNPETLSGAIIAGKP